MKYKNVLLKISGEALAGNKGLGIDLETLNFVAEEIGSVVKAGARLSIVIGGGNIHRGVAGATQGMDRSTSDYMGMLATTINSLAVQDALERRGLQTRVMSAIRMDEVAEPQIRRKAMRHLEKGRIVIFAAGTGNPYFSTDTAAALRANETSAEILIKATKVDGVYDKDPEVYKDAVKHEKITYMDVLNQQLKVMDSTAISLCMENSVPILVLDLNKKGSILKAVLGDKIGTLIA